MAHLRSALALCLFTLLSLAAPFNFARCSVYYLFCEDRTACIRREWICDGTRDCRDGSDEAHCEVNKAEEGSGIDFNEEEENEFRNEILAAVHADVLCDEEGCIRCTAIRDQLRKKILNSSLICDGRRDCPFGEDEGDRCYECSSRLYNRCSHTCINDSRGHKCSCPRGMILGSDESTCELVDECLRDGQRCSQMCSNLSDGYECSCAPGYELDKDRHSCHLREKDMDGTIYVALDGEIRAAPMFSPQPSARGHEKYVEVNNYGQSRSLALDIRSGRMFSMRYGVLTVVENGRIKNLRENVTDIKYVAVDWVGRNVLYTVDYPSPVAGIYLCKMNGLYCRRIIRGVTGARKSYKGLAVNPLKGLVAWVEGSEDNHKIMVANLDGSDVKTVLDQKRAIDEPSFDVIRNEIYFFSMLVLNDFNSVRSTHLPSAVSLIKKINLDSRRRTTVLYTVNVPYSLAFFDNRIYWTEWNPATLKVASVDVQHSTPHLLSSFADLPYGIALNHSFVQPPLRANPCEDNACPWMCVAVRSGDKSSPLEGRCICPDEYEINGEFNSTIKGSLPCKMKKDLDANDLTSHVSVEAMEEYCETGEVCFNGGSCIKHANTRGRVVRITCECADGYSGLFCEIPRLPDADDSLDADDKTKLAVQNEEGSGYDL